MKFNKNKKIRGIGISSGGLDSILSAMILRAQGIEVYWVSFETPFFSSINAINVAKDNNIPISVIDISEIYIRMMQNRLIRFGKNMNPCIDCHSIMIRIAGDVMIKNGFDFLFSGEVLGQRPMSQNRFSLNYVEKASGYNGYLVRPLSGKKLVKTIPEEEGIVNRDLLSNISGRSRKPQMLLAKKFGIRNYPSPGGGCLLTDEKYCVKLKKIFKIEHIFFLSHLYLLKFGRHLYFNEKIKIVVGRNNIDNEKIRYYFSLEKDLLLQLDKIPGPIVIILNYYVNDDILDFVISICLRYSSIDRCNSIVVS